MRTRVVYSLKRSNRVKNNAKEWITNKDLLYSTGKSAQYYVTT